MKKAMLAATAATMLTFIPAAQAKEIALTAVCGPSGCNAIKPAVVVGHDGMRAGVLPPLQSYYVLRIGFGDGRRIVERGEEYFIPGTGVVAAKDAPGPTDGWAKLPERAAAAARKAAAGLKPFSAPVPSRVSVGSRRVADPAAFLALLGPLERAAVPRTGESPIPIAVDWARANPWSTAASLLSYLPKARIVIRLDGFFRVPVSVADRIDRVRRAR